MLMGRELLQALPVSLVYPEDLKVQYFRLENTHFTLFTFPPLIINFLG
jgi:hypothetical protein